MSHTARLVLAWCCVSALSACSVQIPTHIPPQAPSELSGPPFDTSALVPDEAASSAQDGAELHIIHTNDMHGQVFARKATWIDRQNPPMVGGFHALAGYVDAVRAEHGAQNVVLVDSGDIFAGTPEGNLTEGKLVVDVMNALKYDAAALGNHEFDLGVGPLAALAKRAEFPFLAANIYTKPSDEGKTADGAVGTMMFIERGPFKLGVIGVIAQNTPEMTHKDAAAAYEFMDPATAIADSVGTLKLDGVNAAVVLSHVGHEEERAMADNAPDGLLAVLGGHSHTPVDPPYRSEATGVYAMQTAGKTSAVNHLVLGLQEGKLVVKSANVVTLMAKDYPEHPAVAQILAKYTPEIEAIMGKVVGECEMTLERRRGPVSSALGNMVTDIMRQQVKADLAVTNKSGIRANLEAGQVTVRSLYQVAPFDNTIVTVSLTGKALKEAFEYAATHGRLHLEVSGATVVYDMDKPEGQRVAKLSINNKPMVPGKVYKVATNSFLADGGDGHKALADGKKEDSGVLLRAAMETWFEANKSCKQDVSKRINTPKAANR